MDIITNLSYLGLAILLPRLTYEQLRKHSEQQYDLQVLNKGLTSKRWLVEIVMTIMYMLTLISFTITDSLSITNTHAFDGWSIWIRIVWIVTMVSVFFR